jgi:release factor glutamine methyltransferase
MTLQEWVGKGEAQLRQGPHPARARRDAETLLLHIIRRNRAALLARWNEVLDAEEAGLYVELIERRFAGEPIQYIFGETEFYGLPFQVTRDVLIPRPETEHLVEKVIELAGRLTEPRSRMSARAPALSPSLLPPSCRTRTSPPSIFPRLR